jgi:hypothetical protein
MRYWYDTEFIEDGETIKLMSIGIVAEDGRELYLQNYTAQFWKANEWVINNVFPRLQDLLVIRGGEEGLRLNPEGQLLADGWTPGRLNKETCWRAPVEIAIALKDFCNVEKHGKPKLWGYYSDLPKGWPMYTRDIKQWCDDLGNPPLPEQGKGEHHALADARWNKQAWIFLRDYEYGLRPGSDRRLKELLISEQ